jgi:choline monooxygenase
VSSAPHDRAPRPVPPVDGAADGAADGALDLSALAIDPDLRRARTLPAAFYIDAGAAAATRARVFARSWQFVGDATQLEQPGACVPVTLLPGLLDEPLLLTWAVDGLLCLSNVCTHRGAILCDAPRRGPQLQCRYHGRRFALDGRMLGAPEFDGALDFPAPRDDLPRVALARWGPLLFASLDPAVPFAEWIAPVQARTSGLPLHRAQLHADRSRDYPVAAHWALYCDNYLEGFHIPWVHPALAGALDYGSYRTELFAHGNLQVGVAAAPRKGGAHAAGTDATAAGTDPVFDLPPGSPDAGQSIAAYYFWLFPNTMVNVYPWGLSLNVVKPVAPDACVVSFHSYVWDEALLDRGASAGLDRVQHEDEAVVESVQRGVRGRLYRGGRYAPAREACVHHFHRLLVAALQQ